MGEPPQIALLPGSGIGGRDEYLPGSYLVESVEHFYTSIDYKG